VYFKELELFMVNKADKLNITVPVKKGARELLASISASVLLFIYVLF